MVPWKREGALCGHITGLIHGHLVLPWDDVCLWNAKPDVSKDVSFAAEVAPVREVTIVSQLSS